MEGKMISEPIERLEDGKLLLKVDKNIYAQESVLAAAYRFTENCYVHIDSSGENHHCVFFKARYPNVDLASQVSNFCNDLIDQQVRYNLDKSNRSIKELIIKKAFFPFEANG